MRFTLVLIFYELVVFRRSAIGDIFWISSSWMSSIRASRFYLVGALKIWESGIPEDLSTFRVKGLRGYPINSMACSHTRTAVSEQGILPMALLR